MEKQSKLEILRDELIHLSKISPKGSHVLVSEKLDISTTHLYKIRKGENVTVNSQENRIFLKKAIHFYKEIIKKEQLKYAAV